MAFVQHQRLSRRCGSVLRTGVPPSSLACACGPRPRVGPSRAIVSTLSPACATVWMPEPGTVTVSQSGYAGTGSEAIASGLSSYLGSSSRLRFIATANKKPDEAGLHQLD